LTVIKIIDRLVRLILHFAKYHETFEGGVLYKLVKRNGLRLIYR